MTTIQILEKNGLSERDMICVYCSKLYSPFTRYCDFCQEYKSMIPVGDAVDCYGEDILGYQERKTNV